MAFEVEKIPDEARLLIRVHETMFLREENRPSSACFKDERLSSNWAKYSCVEHTKNAKSAAVVSLIVKECHKVGQTVEHTPIEADRSLARIRRTRTSVDRSQNRSATNWLRCPESSGRLIQVNVEAELQRILVAFNHLRLVA